MKNIKSYVLGLSLVVVLFSCDTKEKERLQSKVDSLTVELQSAQMAEQSMSDVGVLLDSIDASRQVLRTKIREGTSYADYLSRLKEINTHIKNTQAKLDDLQKNSTKASNSQKATIKRLKADLALRSEEITSLQLDILRMRDENTNLWVSNNRKDSLLSAKDEMIKVKEGDVSSLEGLVEDINEQNRIKVANLYYGQAQALETAANRTKFAPRKKKETRKEALELYRLAQSMGNIDAPARIAALEKELS